MHIPQSTAYRCLIKAYLDSDHFSDATGKTIAVVISKNGGAFGNPSGGATNATEIGSGWYYVDLSTTDTGTTGPLIVRGTETDIDNAEVWSLVVPATNGIMTAIPNAVAGASGGLRILGANAGNTSYSGTTSFAGNVDYTEGVFIAGGAQGHALRLSAAATSHGIYATGNTTGSGARFEGGATGNGMMLVGGGTSGDGLNCAVTSGDEIDANITGNLSGSVGSVAAGGIAAASFAAGAIDAAAIASNAIGTSEVATTVDARFADAFLGRTISGGTSGGRTVTEALAMLRHRVVISAGVATVYAADDTTPLFTLTVATTPGDPISSLTP